MQNHTTAEEIDFIDYLHELMRDENGVVAQTATAIFCKFIEISVDEFNEDTRKMRELIPLIDETFGKQEA